jgi:hypothetical protein
LNESIYSTTGYQYLGTNKVTPGVMIAWSVFAQKYKDHSIQYAIEITTDSTTVTSATWGIVNGIFRYITGRPGYNAVGQTYPLWEDLTENQYVWYEGFLLRDELSNPNRSVDISMTGEYGTNSGFTFSFLNTSMIWKYLEDNSIYLTNRSVKFYTVIGGTFIQCWDGVIEDTARDEAGFHVRCTDSYRVNHKYLPKNLITKTNLSDVEDQDQGEAVPIVFGDANYVKLRSIKDLINEPILLSYGSKYSVYRSIVTGFKVAAISGYSFETRDGYQTSTNSVQVRIFTNYKSFAENELVDKYLHVKSGDTTGSDNLMDDEIIRVIGNQATNTTAVVKGVRGPDYWYETILYLAEPLVGVLPEDFTYNEQGEEETTFAYIGHDDYRADYNIIKGGNDKCWWIELLTVTNELVVSDGELNSFVRNARGEVQLFAYDKDNNRYYDIGDLIDSITTDSEGRTVIKLLNNALTYSGEIKVITGIPITDARFVGSSKDWEPFIFDQVGDANNSIKKNPWATNVPMIYSIDPVPDNSFIEEAFVELELDIDGTYDLSKYEDVAVGFDIETYVYDSVVAPAANLAIEIYYQVKVIDVYGNPIKFFEGDDSDPDAVWKTILLESDPLQVTQVNDTAYTYRFLPKDYYRNSGYNYNTTSIYQTTQTIDSESRTVSSWLTLPSEYNDLVKKGVAKSIRLSVHCRYANAITTRYTLKLYQVAIFGKKTVESTNGDLYTVVEGVKGSDGLPTNNVYKVFKYMFEDNDGIPASDIDYDNVDTTRNTWWCGRQITDYKNTFDYINELAKQSFVAIYPMRDGKRRLTAWREAMDRTAETHNEANIVRDSIRSWGKTNLNQVYNNFYLRYSWDIGFKKFLRSMFVAKIDQTTFPAEATITDASVGNDWMQYVGGLPDGTYPDALDLWDVCHKSYLRDKTVSPLLPRALADLYWYFDITISNIFTVLGRGTDNSAFKFLKNACEWLTRQKEYVTYSIPMTEDNLINIELMNRVSFTDKIYTDDIADEGWITKVEYDTKKDQINVTVMFAPKEEQSFGGDGMIVERGINLNFDTVIEQTTNTNIVIETGVTGMSA